MKRSIALFFVMTMAVLAAAGQTVYSSSKGEKVSYRNSTGLTNFNVETRGKIELTDDDKDIKSMSADGYLEVTKTAFGSRRSIVITPQGGGLKREYYEGRTAIAFAPEGRKWLSEILPEIVRTTTVGAESRVNRFYKQGGSNAVVNEIQQLDNAHVKAHYANVLMGLNPPAKDYSMIAGKVADTMDSDHYLNEFLKTNMGKFLQTKEGTEAVFSATRKMDSDHYKTETIKEALHTGPASLENVKIIMQATTSMESDHYKSEVMTALLRQSNITDAVISEMVNASKSIESDHYKSVVLDKALEKEGLSSTSYNRVIESVKDMESDHYKSQVLTHLIKNNMSPDAQVNLINLLSSIGSDHYITQVANEITKKQTMSDDTFQKLIQVMADHSESDYYLSTFMQSALQRPNVTKQNLTTILQSVGRIESDHYVTEVLLAAAPKIKAMNDSSLKDLYRTAAKNIESDTYYGRAVKAID